jgi:hypothetical protein
VKLLVLVLLILNLTACSYYQVKEYETWTKEGKLQAEHGELKWSEYYKGCFSRLAATPNRMDGKSFDLEHLNKMIGYSLDFESGHLTASEFEEKGRLAEIERAKGKDANSALGKGASERINLQTTY